MGIDTSFGCIIILIFTTIIGVVCLGVTFEGYFLTTTRWYERIIFAIIAALTIDPNIYTDIIGGILLAIVLTLQYLRIKIKKTYL